MIYGYSIRKVESKNLLKIINSNKYKKKIKNIL